MALIRCVDCGKEVSDRAKTCPNCGCPIECSITETQVEKADSTEKPIQNDSYTQLAEIQAKNKIKFLSVCGVSVLLVIVLIVGLLIKNNSHNSDDFDFDNQDNYSPYEDTYNNDNNYIENNNNFTSPSHTHFYISKITKEATCAAQGITTYSCNCGDSYTEPIPTTSHFWLTATCKEPKKCNVCGATEGGTKEHIYYSTGECSLCGQMDPLINETLSKCSLTLPSLPKTVNYKNVNGKLYSTVIVTDIQYSFKYEGDGTVSLTANFSGTKTYDYLGAGQSSSCKVGWKVYDANGNVFKTGSFSSPNVAMGESFVNQKDDLIYNFQKAAPGAYRLEILDVN